MTKSNQRKRLENSLKIAGQLRREDHEKLVKTVIHSVGLDCIELLAIIIQKRIGGKSDHHQLSREEIIEASSALTAMLLALYLNKNIMFRDIDASGLV